jgi:tRNA pseudouridine55 synthase
MRLGVVTDTQDMTGNVLRESPVHVTREELEAVMRQFLGDYDQIPPMYSALKVQGKKLYELAREGRVIERKPRRVQILGLELRGMEEDGIHVHMRVHCSKGTYIRTLCHDIGERLGCGAAMEKLIRTRVGVFKIEDALTLAQVEVCVQNQKIDHLIRSIDSMFSMWPAGRTGAAVDRLLYNGNMLYRKDMVLEEKREPESGEKFRIYDSQGQFCAVYVYDGRHRMFKNEKMFV